jgi:hypothetical protein
LALGFLAATLWVLLASVRIDAQGPQYDELHQATGAFTWLGSPPEMFCTVAFHRVCVLNMPYSAAIKTNLYGLYLRFVHPRFTLASWRMLGILLIAGGILLFCAAAWPALPAGPMAVFLALLLSDGAVLLDGRFDWGPVAISLLLRLALLGLWMRGEAGEGEPPLRNTAALGALAGLAVFEKLSAVVLVPALAALLLGSARRRSRRHLLAAAAGLVLGAAPLAAVNVATLLRWGRLVSPVGGGAPVPRALGGFLSSTGEYLSLGQGGPFRDFMLGLPRWPWAELLERGLVLAVVLAIAAAAARKGMPPLLRAAASALAAYAVVWLALPLLGRPTWAHHWILGTPFQYAALALALAARPHSRGDRRALALLAALWLGLRLPDLASIESALARGSASLAWDPSFASIGEFAESHAGEAVFVASDWGVATQIYCLANGRPGLVREPFWRYHGPGDLDGDGRRLLYLVRLRNPPLVVPGATERIERDLAADPRWREVPVEPEAASLREVLVRKFVPAGLPKGSFLSPSPPRAGRGGLARWPYFTRISYPRLSEPLTFAVWPVWIDTASWTAHEGSASPIRVDRTMARRRSAGAVSSGGATRARPWTPTSASPSATAGSPADDGCLNRATRTLSRDSLMIVIASVGLPLSSEQVA